MPSTVRAAFAEFAARLEPTDKQSEDAAAKHIGVRDCLNTKLWVSSAFLTGSYGRRTMIRPPSDIDLFVVLDYSKHGNDFYTAYNGAQVALERFHTVLKGCYPDTPIRKDHPAVHLDFTTYGFDVVPAFARSGGGYYIPSRFVYGWMPTDPEKHAALTTDMNKATGGYFVPLVKMFKAWNRAHYERLTGFHLEVALANGWPKQASSTYPYNPVPAIYTSYAQAAAALFSPLSAQLAYYCADPAGLSGNIDTYLSPDDRTRTGKHLNAAASEAQIALRHEAREDHYSAINKWREIFGDQFPAYSY